MTANQSGTFSYAPDIACSIYTTSGVLDVSADIIDVTVTRNIAAVSQVQMDLANPGKKYNGVINTMDRIVVFLKRTDWVQVFTGYVTLAPVETLIPTSVNVSADCTLRILQNTYWDDTLQQFQQLLLNTSDYAAASSNATLNDGGVAQAIINLLTGVCGWNPENIHIQGIPRGLLEVATKGYKGVTTGTAQNAIAELATVLGSVAYVAGNSAGTAYTASGQPPGTGFKVTHAQAFYTTPLGDKAKENYPGHNHNNPVEIDKINHDMFYASVPFTYSTFTSNSGGQIDNAKQWISQHFPNGNKDDEGSDWRGRWILVSNIQTNRVVALRATSLVQKPNHVSKQNTAIINNDIANINYIQVHPGVLAYLAHDIDRPINYDPTSAKPIPAIAVHVDWADEKAVKTIGAQKNITAKAAAAAKAMGIPGADAIPSNPKSYLTAQQAVIRWAVSQKGARYSQDLSGPHFRETPKSAKDQGSFDCSGLMQWSFSKIGVNIGANTYEQWGTGTSSDNKTHGTFIPVTERPQPGDLLFWFVYGDDRQPGHVTMLTKGFDDSGVGGMMMGAHGGVITAGLDPVNWSNIQFGGAMPGWGMNYMGARRPLDLTDPTRKYTFQTTTTVPDKSSSANPLSPDSNVLSLAGSFSMLMVPPTFDARASTMLGTPRAFLLDNNVLSDFRQIVGAGLRTFMSAPNGDFVAWFPDYFGFYGTDPVLDISAVEIIDFQIYHDDNQLVTHYGVIGDVNGLAQQVSFADYVTTNGIVSIEDGGTMNVLFGKSSSNTGSQGVINFLQRYGMRPMAKEQNMIRTHIMEYVYALTGFMNQWVNQYASTVSLTFMPELYPGMRINMDIDDDTGNGTTNYQFYCTSVTHSCSRVAGFTTQATLTAPMKNGVTMDYGLGLI